jgi:hypothetical protein
MPASADRDPAKPQWDLDGAMKQPRRGRSQTSVSAPEQRMTHQVRAASGAVPAAGKENVVEGAGAP